MIILSESRTQTVKQMVLEAKWLTTNKKLDSNKIKIIIKKNELVKPNAIKTNNFSYPGPCGSSIHEPYR